MSNSILDLGVINQPLLIFGGPYSNLAATQALLAKAQELNIAPDHIICTGDVVAYCAEAEQTTKLVIASDIHVVKGNCEESLAQQSADCGCGFEPGMTCSALSEKWYRYANTQISEPSRNWMGSLPSAIIFKMGQFRCRVIHGGVEQINRFIFGSTDLATKHKELTMAKTDIIIGGHCGLPFGQSIETQGWLNAGVIGLPANDGTSSVWYMLLTPAYGGFTASWHRLQYEYSTTYQSMIENKLDEYAETLITGNWPSMDILPRIEQSQQGLNLDIQPLTFGTSK